MKEAALALAQMGWAIFPLKPRSKEPLLPKSAGGSGVYDGTTDLSQVEAWWTEHPEANIGLHCRGLLVLDLDAKAPKGGGLTGIEALDALQAEHGVLPTTLMSRTGSGGFHLFFVLPPGAGVKNRVAVQVKGQKTGLDVRTSGGYVLLPPSIHPNGTPYCWENDAPIVEPPAWLLTLLNPAPVKREKSGMSNILEFDRERAWGARQLQAACERIRTAPEGQRHETLARTAYWMGGLLHLLDPSIAEEELIQAGLDSGKKYREVAAAVKSGFLKGSAVPLQAPSWQRRVNLPPEEPPPPFVDGSGSGAGEGVPLEVAPEPPQTEVAPTTPPPGPAPATPKRLAEVLPGLPEASADLVVPEGYLFSKGGVFRLKEHHAPQQVCLKPLWVSALASDADGGGSSVKLHWHDGRSWRHRWVPRGMALVARELAKLAQHDLPVTSVNSHEVVRFLDAFLAENAERLPTSKTSPTLGWRGPSFLWGNQVIGEGGIELVQDEELPLAEGYRAVGTWEGWCEGIQHIVDLPKVYLALLAALVPPLYRFLEAAPGFGLDLSAKTSGGKTSALRVAASVWGVPQDEGHGLIRTWDSSLTSIERLAAFSNYLPLLLDDTRRVAQDQQPHLQRVVYTVTQGQGRGRATITGMQKQATWRTVMISTGEDRLVDLMQAGGAAARVLCLWGSPFGEGAREKVDAVREKLHHHHGHAGPKLVRWMLEPGHEEVLKGIYRHWLNHWQTRAGDNQVASRAAGYLGLLSTALELAKKLGIPAPTVDPMQEAWAALGVAQEEAALEVKALRLAYEWAVARQDAFIGRESSSKVPSGGWLGRWNAGDMWEYLAFLPEPLEQMLLRAGFQPRTIFRTWAEKGWIQKNGKNLEYPTTLAGGARARCIRVLRKETQSVLVLPEVEEEP